MVHVQVPPKFEWEFWVLISQELGASSSVLGRVHRVAEMGTDQVASRPGRTLKSNLAWVRVSAMPSSRH